MDTNSAFPPLPDGAKLITNSSPISFPDLPDGAKLTGHVEDLREYAPGLPLRRQESQINRQRVYDRFRKGFQPHQEEEARALITLYTADKAGLPTAQGQDFDSLTLTHFGQPLPPIAAANKVRDMLNARLEPSPYIEFTKLTPEQQYQAAIKDSPQSSDYLYSDLAMAGVPYGGPMVNTSYEDRTPEERAKVIADHKQKILQTDRPIAIATGERMISKRGKDWVNKTIITNTPNMLSYKNLPAEDRARIPGYLAALAPEMDVSVWDEIGIRDNRVKTNIKDGLGAFYRQLTEYTEPETPQGAYLLLKGEFGADLKHEGKPIFKGATFASDEARAAVQALLEKHFPYAAGRGPQRAKELLPRLAEMVQVGQEEVQADKDARLIRSAMQPKFKDRGLGSNALDALEVGLDMFLSTALGAGISTTAIYGARFQGELADTLIHDHDTNVTDANAISGYFAPVYALIERSQIAKVAPSQSAILAKTFKKKLLANLTYVMKKRAVSTLTEIGEESAQAAIENAAKAAAKEFSDAQGVEYGDLVQDWMNQTVEAAKTMPWLMAPGGTIEMGKGAIASMGKAAPGTAHLMETVNKRREQAVSEATDQVDLDGQQLVDLGRQVGLDAIQAASLTEDDAERRAILADAGVPAEAMDSTIEMVDDSAELNNWVSEIRKQEAEGVELTYFPRTADQVQEIIDTPEARRASDGMHDTEPAASLSIEQITAHVDTLGFGDAVQVVQSAHELPESVLQQAARRGYDPDGIDGVWDDETGKAYVVADNITDLATAEQKALHEAAGHMGIAKVLGADAEEQIMNMVLADGDFKAFAESTIKDVAKEYAIAEDSPEAHGEVLARWAETVDYKLPLWRNVAAKVREFFRAIGFVKEWTDDDIRNLLINSRRAASTGDKNVAPDTEQAPRFSMVQDKGNYTPKLNNPYIPALDGLPEDLQKIADERYEYIKRTWHEDAPMPPRLADLIQKHTSFYSYDTHEREPLNLTEDQIRDIFTLPYDELKQRYPEGSIATFIRQYFNFSRIDGFFRPDHPTRFSLRGNSFNEIKERTKAAKQSPYYDAVQELKRTGIEPEYHRDKAGAVKLDKFKRKAHAEEYRDFYQEFPQFRQKKGRGRSADQIIQAWETGSGAEAGMIASMEEDGADPLTVIRSVIDAHQTFIDNMLEDSRREHHQDWLRRADKISQPRRMTPVNAKGINRATLRDAAIAMAERQILQGDLTPELAKQFMDRLNMGGSKDIYNRAMEIASSIQQEPGQVMDDQRLREILIEKEHRDYVARRVDEAHARGFESGKYIERGVTRLREERTRREDGAYKARRGINPSVMKEQNDIDIITDLKDIIQEKKLDKAKLAELREAIHQAAHDQLILENKIQKDAPQHRAGKLHQRVYQLTFSQAFREIANSYTRTVERHSTLKMIDKYEELSTAPAIDKRQVAILYRLQETRFKEQRDETLKKVTSALSKKDHSGTSTKDAKTWKEDSVAFNQKAYLEYAWKVFRMSGPQAEKAAEDLQDGAKIAKAGIGHSQFENYLDISTRIQILDKYSSGHMRTQGQLEDAYIDILRVIEEGQKLHAERFKKVTAFPTKAVPAIKSAIGVAKERYHSSKDRGLKRSAAAFLTGLMSLEPWMKDVVRRGTEAARQAADPFIMEMYNDTIRGYLRANVATMKNNEWIKEATEKAYNRPFAEALEYLDETIPGSFGRYGIKKALRRQDIMQLYAGGIQTQYEGNQVNAAELQQLRAALNDEDINFLAELRTFYDKLRPQLNEVSIALTGIPVITPDANYLPVKIDRPDAGVRGEARGFQTFPTFITPRIFHNRLFDEEAGILDLWLDRSQKSANYIHLAEPAVKMMLTYGDEAVHQLIKDQYGEQYRTDFYATIFDSMTGSKPKSTQGAESLLELFKTTYTLSRLSLNPVSMLRQATSVPAFLFHMDTEKFMDHLKTVASKESKEAMLTILRSDYARERMGAFNADIAEAMARIPPGKMGQFLRKGMRMPAFGDIAPTLLIGQGIYRERFEYYQANNADLGSIEASRLALEDVFIEANRTQQSSLLPNQSLIRRRNTVLGKSMMMFTGSISQYLEKEALTVRGLMADNTPTNRKKLGKILLINHVLLPGAYNLATILANWFFGDEPDEDDIYRLMISMLLGPASGLFLVGGFAAGFLGAAVQGKGSFFASVSPLSGLQRTITDGGKLIHDALTGDWDDLPTDMVDLITDNIAPARYAKKLYDKHKD